MTNVVTVKRQVKELRERLAPKRKKCIAWLEQDGKIHTYERNGKSGKTLRIETQEDCVKRFESYGCTDIIFLTWEYDKHG